MTNRPATLRDTLRDADALTIWTLYDNPKDYPGMFVLREWAITGGDEPQPLPGTFVAPRIETLRSQMEGMGLTCLPRSPGDEPHIVECWI